MLRARINRDNLRVVADFRFTNEYSSSQREGVLDVLRRPRLWVPEADYPDYQQWLGKVEAQLGENEKRAMVSYLGPVAVGAIVYQRHRSRPNTVEIKNISVQPDARGRYVGSFLLRNVELEATRNDFPECNELIVDTKISNLDMITFLMRHHYSIAGIDDLYRLGAGSDATLVKTVSAPLQ